MANTAKGFPTKEFFVGMLTRDIDLSDAILDLLDNCLDGVLRQKKSEDRQSDTFYEGYFSHISFDQNSFIIEDNCGGIPRKTAEDYAFRMGSSDDKPEDNLPTVGIYGIGMKRAIFKVGRSAEVITCNDNESYKVTIPLEWSEAGNDKWDFNISELDGSDLHENGGTRIKIADINSDIVDLWDNETKVERYTMLLFKAIQQSYSFIIEKGFQITINGVNVEALPIKLLFATGSNGIQPYLYSAVFDEDVKVSLAIGFYAPPPSPEEIDDENKMKRSTADAGWTVVCNDRVVLYNDKSHLTGWGEAGVPSYHTQFIGIRGIVIFESKSPKKLPMTTTKRGVDTSSKIYAVVKDRMRTGMRLFTDYTNRWKGQNEKERSYSSKANSISINTFVGNRESIEKEVNINFRKNKEGFVYQPVLPKPEREKPYATIRYSKDMDDISEVIKYFYSEAEHEITPSQVGEKCFDEILEAAKGKGR